MSEGDEERSQLGLFADPVPALADVELEIDEEFGEEEDTFETFFEAALPTVERYVVYKMTRIVEENLEAVSVELLSVLANDPSDITLEMFRNGFNKNVRGLGVCNSPTEEDNIIDWEVEQVALHLFEFWKKIIKASLEGAGQIELNDEFLPTNFNTSESPDYQEMLNAVDLDEKRIKVILGVLSGTFLDNKPIRKAFDNIWVRRDEDRKIFAFTK
ncbi:hypothetical protein ACFL3C_01485 [Patescibacteria group bacterium]